MTGILEIDRAHLKEIYVISVVVCISVCIYFYVTIPYIIWRYVMVTSTCVFMASYQADAVL